MTEPQETITDSLRSDHRAIADLLASRTIADTTDDALVERERLVMNLIRHFVAEEQYLYPTVRDLGDDTVAGEGERQFAADRDLENHLRALETPELTQEAVATVLATARAGVEGHVAAQRRLFDALEARCAPDALAELGADSRGAEQLAPTRPRRVIPRDETTNKIVSFVEGYLDHIRDHYSRRGIEPEPE